MSFRHLDELLLKEGRKRLVFLSLVLAFLFSLLLIQFYRVQIVEGSKWQAKALKQHQVVVKEPCRRGAFYSNTSLRKGHPEEKIALAFDVEKTHLYADAKAISEALKPEIVTALEKMFDLSEEKKHSLEDQLMRPSRSRKLLVWLDQDQRKKIELWWYPFAKKHKIARNALFFVQDYQRSYPFGSMLGQILHTVREVKDPETLKQIPTGGLELSLDKYLQGKEGKRVFWRSPRNPLDLGKVIEEPEDGSDVYLTINHHLQALVEEEIAKAVDRAGAKNGWAMMMDPHTGEILAWAQYPFFDPSNYRAYFNDPNLQARAEIKGIIEPFEPGSIMKPLTMALCFKANEELARRGEKPLFSPDEKVATSKGYFSGRSKPVQDVRLHRYLNMYMALQKSSNIYVARMAQRIVERLGDQWYRDSLAEVFGFGSKTGIELPSESPGFLPSLGKTYPGGALQWSKPTPYSISFGYNLLASSLQMLRAYAILCNGGFSVEPHLVKKIVHAKRNSGSEVLFETKLESSSLKREPLISSRSLSEVLKAMMYVTKKGGGGTRADISGYTEAGKTGTSEKVIQGGYSKKDHISSFLGFCPALNPRFVLMVVIDEPERKVIPGVGKNQMGGICAAPCFREIGRKALEYLGVEPDDPYGFPFGDPRRDASKAVWHKENQSLSELYKQWNP